MTDTEAEAMLLALRAHYGQPVLPMSRFCSAIRTWFRCIEEENKDATDADPGHGYAYSKLLRRIDIDISKSSLLARLLYGGQSLRKTRCPEHDGHWSGHPLVPCAHGCQDTGWVSAPHTYAPKVFAWEDGKPIADPYPDGPPVGERCTTCGGVAGGPAHTEVSP